MIDEMLRDLARTPFTVPARPLAEVLARAKQRRRRQIGGGTVATLASGLVLAAVGFGVLNGTASERPQIDAPAGAKASPPCPPNRGQQVRRLQDAADVLYLPPSSLTGPTLGQPSVRVANVGVKCPANDSTAWYALQGDRVSRTFEVRGPNALEASAQPRGDAATTASSSQALDDPESGEAKSSVDVNGFAGTLYYGSRCRCSVLYWTTALDGHWMSLASGVSLNQAVALTRSVLIVGNHVDRQRSLLAGFPNSVGPPSDSARTGGGFELDVNYAGTGQNDSWGLLIAQSNLTLRPVVGDRRVEINGRIGWLNSDHMLNWQVADGVVARVVGSLSESKAVQVARAMVKVSPDDPRVRRAEIQPPQ